MAHTCDRKTNTRTDKLLQCTVIWPDHNHNNHSTAIQSQPSDKRTGLRCSRAWAQIAATMLNSAQTSMD